MKIISEKTGKKYQKQWIFRNFSRSFDTGNSYAILGPNGSGKSTLLKILSGYLSPSQGKVLFQNENKVIDTDSAYRFISFSAPYIDLIEEFSIEEQINFHFRFKLSHPKTHFKQIISILQFEDHKDKLLAELSSGMRQRLKLALSLINNDPIALLDEPATNLDKEGIKWYRNLVETYTESKIVIVASNRAEEYEFCNYQILIEDYKG